MLTTLFDILLILLGPCISWIIYPRVYRVALKHKIIDRSSQSNQQQAIPLLGGLVVVLAATLPIGLYIYFHSPSQLTQYIPYVLFFLLLGIVDDVRNLSTTSRLIIETLVVAYFVYAQDMLVHFHGLWNIHQLPLGVTILLSVIAGVGIINCINMIDGVDGYSSGLGIISCGCFGLFFYCCHQHALAIFLFVVAACIIPFYIYNVFGQKKMYFGDGGTHMLGAILSMCVFQILSNQSTTYTTTYLPHHFGLIPFCLAVLCIPVFDALRVIIGRIIRGASPFTGDTTHLHHLFLQIGFAHWQTSLTIIALNTCIILLWWISYRAGMSINGQLYIVGALGILATFGLSIWLQHISKNIRNTENNR